MISKGDRVRVYATLFGVKAESKGKVLEVRRKDGMFRVVLDKTAKDGKQTYPRLIWAHPKQCRKLKRKALPVPRRAWISGSLAMSQKPGLPYVNRQWTCQHCLRVNYDRFRSEDFVEFVEARLRKELSK